MIALFAGLDAPGQRLIMDGYGNYPAASHHFDKACAEGGERGAIGSHS